MFKRHSIAICGLGRAGSIHTGNCVRNPRANIKYFVEIDLQKAEQVKQEYGLDNTTIIHADDFQKVLDDKDVEGVIICTVTWQHEFFVRQCIQGRKAIFCEKPIAENLEKTISCYEEAERAGVPLFCAFNRRFDASHAAVKKAATDGEVGQLQMVKVCSRDSPVPTVEYLKISGGIFHDCAVHDIDMMTWIAGEHPIEVFTHAHAFQLSIREMGDVDTVSISLKFASGMIGQIDLSRYAAYGYDQRVEVFGAQGMLQSENQNKTSVRKCLAQEISKDTIKYSFPQRYPEAYAAEIAHFIDVLNGKQPLIKKIDVCMVSLIASACEESHKTGKPMRINKDALTFEPTY